MNTGEVIGGAVALLIALGLGSSAARKAVGYVAGKLVEIDLASIGNGHQLRTDAATAFLAMRAAAASAGVELKVNSSFRTNEQQATLYELYQSGAGALAAKPGYSNHQNGRAIDVETGGGKNAAFTWLTQNAGAFGFRRTVASEPWHWEYVA